MTEWCNVARYALASYMAAKNTIQSLPLAIYN